MNWISVKDTLPGSNADVLVSDGTWMAVGYYDADGYDKWKPSNVDSTYDMASAVLDFTVTHWTPLPALPTT